MGCKLYHICCTGLLFCIECVKYDRLGIKGLTKTGLPENSFLSANLCTQFENYTVK